MPFHTEKTNPIVLKAETLAICLILACSLQIMENLLPRIPIFPWLRLGLAYWILLPFLIRFGVFQTLILFLLRNLITLFYGGQIFSAFLISSSAGVVSIILAGSILITLYRRKKLGLIGFSVLMACTFNLAQLIVVNQLLVQHFEFYYQLPPILFWSVISGSLIALLVYRSQSTLDRLFRLDLSFGEVENENAAAGGSRWTRAALTAGCCMLVLILYLKRIEFQVGLIPVLLIINRFRNLKVLLFAWPFYLYIAILHLFRTDGVYILGEWITQEGLDSFLFYAARITNVILCGQWIAGYIPAIIKKQPNNLYIRGFIYALPILPAIFGISIALGKDLIRRISKKEFDNLLEPIIQRLVSEFNRLDQRN